MHCYNTETRSLLEHIVATLHADIVITMWTEATIRSHCYNNDLSSHYYNSTIRHNHLLFIPLVAMLTSKPLTP
jgi:hypothetical protein